MNFFRRRYNRFVMRAHQALMQEHGMRVIFLGPEDAAVVMSDPQKRPYVHAAVSNTPAAIMNGTWAVAFRHMTDDPTGLMSLREAVQDVAASVDPEVAIALEGTWEPPAKLNFGGLEAA